MKKKEEITIRLTYEDRNGNEQKYMFGTSYKTWQEQIDEFIWTYRKEIFKIISVEKADLKWGFCGLKWCHFDNFQKYLDEDKRDLKAANINFYYDRKSENKVIDIWEDTRHLLTNYYSRDSEDDGNPRYKKFIQFE